MKMLKYIKNIYRKLRKWLCMIRLKENLSCLFEIVMIGCLIFLLGDTLYQKVFKSLWEYLSLQNTLALKCTVLVIASYCLYQGYNISQKYIDKKHVAFAAIILVYIYYKFFFKYCGDDYPMILVFGRMDSFAVLFVAFVTGLFSGRAWNYYRKKKNSVPQSSDRQDCGQGCIPIYLDEPITGSRYDLFKYTGLAKRLAYTIDKKTFDKSYSIGINSPWGAGKSSFLNLLREELSLIQNTIVVDFNARASANVSCIQSDFLSILATALSPYHTGMKSTIKDYMADINVLANDTPWMKFLGLFHVKDATESREKLKRGIDVINKKIIIIIDDLDRLTTDEILEVFKLITKNAAFKNTVFITTYDKNYINGMLEQNLCVPQKQRFSDKYFNMEIDLPEGDGKIRSTYLLNELIKQTNDGLLNACNEHDLRRVFSNVSKYAERYLPTLRDVKRFLNTFCVSYLPIQDEVFLKDYIMLSLIRYARKDVYDGLKRLIYFEDTRSKHKNIYILRSGDVIDSKEDYDALCELFPLKHNGNIDDINEKGQKHIYWKRSFNAYFYNLEYTNLHHTDVKALLKSNLTDAEVRKMSESWSKRGIEVDIKDFLLSIEDYQSTRENEKAFLKLCMICYRYTKEREIYTLASRAMYYYEWDKVQKKFNFKTQAEYKQYICDILKSENDVNATSFFLHHLLFYQLSENRIKAEDCVFTDEELKKLCLDRLEKGLGLFKTDKISASDVLYLGLACLNDADPNDSGSDGYDIMPEALDKLKSSIKENPQKYLCHVISHVAIGANKIKFTVKKDFPFRDIFSIDELKDVISSIDTHQDSALETICNFWLQYLDYCKNQKKASPTVAFEGDISKLREYDCGQYNLVFEGENIQ